MPWKIKTSDLDLGGKHFKSEKQPCCQNDFHGHVMSTVQHLSSKLNLYARWEAGQEPVEGAKVVHQPVQPQPRDHRLTLSILGLQQISWKAPTCCCLVCWMVH